MGKFGILLCIILTLALIPLSAQAYQDQYFCINKTYEDYKKNFLTKEGRVMDPERGDITVSEGQCYMLIRSVFMGDKKTFDLVYNWTKKHIQRKDKLLSWFWGKDRDGRERVLDENSAADADVNLAFALILAKEKWKDDRYLKEAIPVMNSVWNKETKKIGKHRVLMPGVVQNKFSQEKIELNPAYFFPLAYKMFKKYDKRHNWNELVDSSYYYIMESSSKTKTGLPPNWFLIENGKIKLENSERSDFSYDAIRVFIKTYYDYIKTGDKRALKVLAKSKFFIKNWKESKTIYINYQANGQLRDVNQFVGGIAILVPVIELFDAKTAREIYKKELEPFYKNPKNWNIKKNYYAKNLLWFGCYLPNREYKKSIKSTNFKN